MFLIIKKIQVTANAGDLINDKKENLPPRSISVFVTGFVAEQIKIENNFKYIKISVIEYVGSGGSGKKFFIRCRYLTTDGRIDKKIVKTRKNSCDDHERINLH